MKREEEYSVDWDLVVSRSSGGVGSGSAPRRRASSGNQ